MTGGQRAGGEYDRLAARQAAVARALASSSEKAEGKALDWGPGRALDEEQVAWSRTQLRIKHAGAIARRAPLLAEAIAATGRSWAAEYVAWAGRGRGGSDLVEAAEFSAHMCGRMTVPAVAVDEMLLLRDLAAGPSRMRVARGCGRWMVRVGRWRRFGGRGSSKPAGA